MKIHNGKRYFDELIKVLSEVGIIKQPKDIRKLIKKGTLHINKDKQIVGWVLQGEIEFWSNDYLDIDEYAQKFSYNDYITLENFSYHFNPEGLKCFRVDKIGENIHANP